MFVNLALQVNLVVLAKVRSVHVGLEMKLMLITMDATNAKLGNFLPMDLSAYLAILERLPKMRALLTVLLVVYRIV